MRDNLKGHIAKMKLCHTAPPEKEFHLYISCKIGNVNLPFILFVFPYNGLMTKKDWKNRYHISEAFYKKIMVTHIQKTFPSFVKKFLALAGFRLQS